MTRQEAIKVLQNEVDCAKTDCFLDCDSCDLYVSVEQALSAHDMAIYALRQEAYCLHCGAKMDGDTP